MRDDEGSATLEFTLVSVLLVFLALGVCQVALVLHVRNTISDAASEGARWAALADSSPRLGAERTRELISSTLGASYAQSVSAERVMWEGVPCVAVTVSTGLPAVGLWAGVIPFEARGHAARELVG